MISADALMLTTLTKILQCSPTPHTCIFTVSPKVNRTINVFLYRMHFIFSLSLYLYQGGIQGVCADADYVFGGRKDLSPEYSSFKRPSIHHKRDPHVHRGWYIYLTILVIIWMCTSYWIISPLSVQWGSSIHLYPVRAGPVAGRPEEQEALWGAAPGAPLQAAPHPPPVQDRQ